MNINELNNHNGRRFTERFCAFHGRNVPVSFDPGDDNGGYVCLCADNCPHVTCRRHGEAEQSQDRSLDKAR
ncbi:MAG: hypothetical protein PUB08_05255 [Firmicutes bacterium]|nr:hypothetical protein [Bacillota bacterium]